jgi:hypothetical protein
MGVAGGGPRALGAEPCLDDPQRDPSFSQMGGLGVPQRLDGSLLRDAPLAHHRVEGLLEGGGERGAGCGRAGNTQGRGRARGQYARHNSKTRGASGTPRSFLPWAWRTHTTIRCTSMSATCSCVPAVRRSPQA